MDFNMMMTDGSIYISKEPLYYKAMQGITNKYCIYCPLIASYIAKELGVKSAQISLANTDKGYRILSKNFLNENEEIVTYSESKELISQYMSAIDENLKMRKFDESEIEEVKFEFLKQEFVAKLIELKDQHANNSPFIISMDEDGKKHVRMAPMFDFDYCFHIAKDVKYMSRKCDNGKVDIGSLIEQYKDYSGFIEFAKTSIEKLDIIKIFKQIYQDKKIEKFNSYQEDEEMQAFIDFVNKNIQLAKTTLEKILKINEREVIE